MKSINNGTKFYVINDTKGRRRIRSFCHFMSGIGIGCVAVGVRIDSESGGEPLIGHYVMTYRIKA